MTNAERILDALRASSSPLDDDALARRTGISRRQQVNQICRRLEAHGEIMRAPGPDGKLVNSIPAHPGRACLCGCGLSTGSRYVPGHDARHASRIASELVAMGPERRSHEWGQILGALPSQALRDKAMSIAEGAFRRSQSARLAEAEATEQPGSLQATATPAVKAGSSIEQRQAERVMLDVLGERLGVTLQPQRLNHDSGAHVELDGATPDLSHLVECWAHQGRAKVAQKYKLVNDATKLAWIAKSLELRPERLILCVSDELAVAHLRGRSWQGAAIRDMGVGIEVVELPSDLIATIVAAQTRQYR